MLTKLCPECGDEISLGAKAHRCGWREFQPKAQKKPVDPLHLICQFMDQGQRCGEYGAISPSTHGEGPWYCRRHYDVVTGRREARRPVAPPQGFQALKAELTRKYPALAVYEREPGEEG